MKRTLVTLVGASILVGLALVAVAQQHKAPPVPEAGQRDACVDEFLLQYDWRAWREDLLAFGRTFGSKNVPRSSSTPPFSLDPGLLEAALKSPDDLKRLPAGIEGLTSLELCRVALLVLRSEGLDAPEEFRSIYRASSGRRYEAVEKKQKK